MTDPFSLESRTFLITGGTRGLGRAISRRFASAGATVIANYVRDRASAESLSGEPVEGGGSLKVLRADVTSPKGLDELERYLDDHHPRLSGFVHCAATGVHHALGELTLRHFDWTYALNVRAFFELVRRLQGRFEPGSSIVAVSSAGAVRAVPQYTLVGSSKGALESLVRHFSVELAPAGIRVNTLSPGTLKTDVWKVLPDSEARLAESERRSPLGRLNTLEEVAAAAQFLCSDAASGIVGHTLVVDGGARIVE